MSFGPLEGAPRGPNDMDYPKCQNAVESRSVNSACSSATSAVQALAAEPRADVGAVAEQEVHPLRVADEVDDLRQVDDHQALACGEDVVRRQVAVHDAVLGHRGQRLAQLLEVVLEQVRLRAGSVPAAAPSPRPG